MFLVVRDFDRDGMHMEVGKITAAEGTDAKPDDFDQHLGSRSRLKFVGSVP
jgi:hypothetical protein